MNPVLTYTGALVNLSQPDPATIRLADISQALTRLQRFNGHTSLPWSIADHSLLVLELLESAADADTPADLGLAAILHDAKEAYVGDRVTPLKQEIARRNCWLAATPDAFEQVADDIDQAIASAFDFDVALFNHPAIKAADLLALTIEAHHLMHPHATTWRNLPALPDLIPALFFREPAEQTRIFASAVEAQLRGRTTLATSPQPETPPC